MDLHEHSSKQEKYLLPVYSTLLLFFSIPFFHKFSNIFIVLILASSLIEIFKQGSIPKIKLHWFLPTLFCYYVISELLSGGSWTSVEKRLQLLVIPIAFAFCSIFYNDEVKRKFYLSYILGNLLAVVICVGRAVVRSVSYSNGGWSFNPKVVPGTEYDFLTSSVMGGNYFFNNEFSLFHNPTYFGILLVFAQYLVFEIYPTTSNRLSKNLLLASYGVFFIALFLISSKAAIFSSLIVTFWILLRAPIPRIVKISFVAGLVILGLFFIFFNPRMKVFKDTLRTHDIIDPNARYGHDLRILSWDASLSVIKENFIIGVGEGRKNTVLIDTYKDKGYVTPAEQMLNSHNQYLDLLLGGGIIAFGLFITGLTHLFIRSIKERNLVLLTFLFIFSFNALFENLLSRHMGILFFSIFISLFTIKRN